jgi:hypothetical protein
VGNEGYYTMRNCIICHLVLLEGLNPGFYKGLDMPQVEKE